MLLLTGTAATNDAAASTSEMLATLEPMMLPTPMSRRPSAAATPDTSISGALVPKPTTIAPTTIGAMRSTTARRAAPRTNWSAASPSTTRPTTENTSPSSIPPRTAEQH